jgi:hypothetical protein
MKLLDNLEVFPDTEPVKVLHANELEARIYSHPGNINLMIGNDGYVLAKRCRIESVERAEVIALMLMIGN